MSLLRAMARPRFAIVTFAAAAAVLQAQPSFYLKDGDRVVFYGDSITDQRLYTAYTEAFALTRFPRLRIDFVHSGWGGDRVSGGAGGPVELRLQRDVTAYRATVVAIMLGMNDGRYEPYDPQTFQTFASGYEHVVSALRMALPNVRITALEPSPYDDITRPPAFAGGYNGVLVRYGGFVRELASRAGLAAADMNSSVVAALRAANGKDPALAQKIVPDRVHPAAAGHLLMAAALLKAWNAPATVTAVEIDAARGRVARAEHAAITELEAGPALAWTQLDDALPMPIDWKDPATNLAVHSSTLMQDLDNQPLSIRGLAPGNYELKIDGEAAGIFSAAQLADSINLAELPTPMARQAAEVLLLTFVHNHIHFARWRFIETPLEKYSLEETRPAMDALDLLESEVVARQRAAAQPTRRRFELTRLAP